MMRDRARVAAVCVDTKPGDIEGNLAKIAAWGQRAARDGARLVLFPELSLTGFIPNHPADNHETWLGNALLAARKFAIELDGEEIHGLTRIAGEHGILLSAGLLEDAGNLLYNTQVLVGPQGVLGRWRKLHIPMFEMPFYVGGHDAPVVDTPVGRIGVNICFDALLPESTRLLAVQNVEIVLMPFAADPPPRTPEGWSRWASNALRGRAMENGVFVVACNYTGTVECAGVTQRFPGGGMIVSPRGEILADWQGPSGEPGMICFDLDANLLAAARAEPEYLFRFRRPELYAPLAQP